MVPYGLVVRMPASHVGGPGSIPGVGTKFFKVVLIQAFSAKYQYQKLIKVPSGLNYVKGRVLTFLKRGKGLSCREINYVITPVRNMLNK